MLATKCPSKERLQHYLDGKLQPEDSDSMVEHLESCSSCEQAADDLESGTSADSLVDLLQSSPAPQDTASASNRASEITSRELPISIAAPSCVASYELLEQIGSGGMGAVFLARHQSLDKEVAIKLLPALPARNPELVARFQREIKAAGKLEHPAIVRTTDAGEEQGVHFLVMDAIDGLDLSRTAKALGKLSIADACEVIRQTALGLSHAHEQGIVHRDIKPSNLMLDEQGQIRILDFGLAQMGAWEGDAAEITSVGQLMGTLDYMAPEQAERGGSVDYRADLYSLGATLFRLLTGRAPLAAAPDLTPLEKLRLLATHSSPKLKTLRPNASDELCELVDSLLSRDPSERPASAAHVAEALEAFNEDSTLPDALKRAREFDTIVDPSQHQAAPAPELQAAEPTPSQLSNDGAWGTTIFKVIATVGFLAAVLFGIWFVIETSKGQLVIESDVADIKIQVIKDGSNAIVDELSIQPGAKATRLRSGKYEIHIDAPSDQFQLSADTFTIRNGETVIARVTRKTASNPPNVTAVDSGAANNLVEPEANTPKNEFTYEGRSLDDWIQIIRFDRSPKKQEEAWAAVAAMASPLTKDSISPLIQETLHLEQNAFSLTTVISMERIYGEGVWNVLARALEIVEPARRLKILEAVSNLMNYDLINQSLASCEQESIQEFLDWCSTQFAPKSQAKEHERNLILNLILSSHFNQTSQAASGSAATIEWLKACPGMPPKAWLLQARSDLPLSDDFRTAMRDEAIQLIDTPGADPTLVCEAAYAIFATLDNNGPDLTVKQSVWLASAIDQRLEAATADIENLRFNAKTSKADLFPVFQGASLSFDFPDCPTHPLVSLLSLENRFNIRTKELSSLDDFHEALSKLPIGERSLFGSNTTAPFVNFNTTTLPSALAQESDSGAVKWRDSANRTPEEQLTFDRQVLYAISGKLLGKSREELLERFSTRTDADTDQIVESGLKTKNRSVVAAALQPKFAGLALLIHPRHKEFAVPHLLKHLSGGGDILDDSSSPLVLQCLHRVDRSRFLENFLQCWLQSPNVERDLLVQIGLEKLEKLKISDVAPLLPIAAELNSDEESWVGPNNQPQRHQILALFREILTLPDEVLAPELQLMLIERLEESKVSNDEFWLQQPVYWWVTGSPGPQKPRRSGTEIRKAVVERALSILEDPQFNGPVKARSLMAIQAAASDSKDLLPAQRNRTVAALKKILAKESEDIHDSIELETPPAGFEQLAQPIIDITYVNAGGNRYARNMSLVFCALNLITTHRYRDELKAELQGLHREADKIDIDPQMATAFQSRIINWPFEFAGVDSQQIAANMIYLQTGEILGVDSKQLFSKPQRDESRRQRIIRPGDVLAVHVPQVLPMEGNPPVLQAGTNPPVTGYPITVSTEGKIKLPYIDSTIAQGLELSQLTDAVQQAYRDNKILVNRAVSDITVEFLMRANKPCEIRNLTEGSNVDAQP